MLLITVCILSIMAVVVFFLFNKDFLTPALVVILGFLFSTLCALNNESTWEINFSIDTTLVILVGIFFFIVGSLCINFITDYSMGQKKNRTSLYEKNIASIYVLRVKTILIIFFQVIIAFFLYKHLGSITGGDSWYAIISVYRDATGANADLLDDTFRLPFFLKQCLRLNFAIGLIYVYINSNNFVVKKEINCINFIPIFFSLFITFMQGYRSDMLRFWIAAIVVTYVLKKRSLGWKNDVEVKNLIKKIILSVIVVALLFVVLTETVGRRVLDYDPLYYLTFYGGCPIAALDTFIKSPINTSNIWGKETFPQMIRYISLISGDTDLLYNFFKEFSRSPNGMYIGNVYTALRPPLYDFGFWGMCIYMFIMGAFFTICYYKVKFQYGDGPIDLRLLIYAYISYTFFMYFYNLYNTFISPGIIRLIFELILIRAFLFTFNVKFKF